VEFDRDNLMAAKVVVGDPEKYAGGCLERARLVLRRLEQPADSEAGPLFVARQ
jgi:hypothetical protein